MRFPPDAPEAPFLRFPKVLSRWTFKAIRKRLRQPAKMARGETLQRRLIAPYLRPRTARRSDRDAGGLSAHAVADFSGRYGLSQAARYELERIRAEHPDVVVHDLGKKVELGVDVEPDPGGPIDILYLLSAPDTYAQLFRRFPPERLRDAWRVGLWVWETPHFPSHWRYAIDLVDEIWTPSEFSRGAIAAAAGDIPVSVRPHAVLPLLDSNRAEARRFAIDRFGVGDAGFLGLSVIDIAACPARKNPWAHVAAWKRAFEDDPGAVLLLKMRFSKRTRVIRAELEQMIGGSDTIRIVEAELTGREITALQAAADVYLSLHRAEGYGLNIHESLALGIPVLATDFSANAEYGPEYPGYQGLPYRLVPYRDWTGHYADRDFEWAEVDLDAAAVALRQLRAASQH